MSSMLDETLLRSKLIRAHAEISSDDVRLGAERARHHSFASDECRPGASGEKVLVGTVKTSG
jgi:hypothetical protein